MNTPLHAVGSSRLMSRISRLIGVVLLVALVSTSLARTQRTAPHSRNLNTIFDLAALNGTNGFVITSGNVTQTAMGYAFAGNSDINGDGIVDFVVGDKQQSKCYVVFGTQHGFPANFSVSALNGTNGFTIKGGPKDALSASIAMADLNGDGFADVIVSAPYASPSKDRLNAGQIYVIFGKRRPYPAILDVTHELNGTNGFMINGIAETDFAGQAVAAAGDLNGDGHTDLIIGARGAHPNNLYMAGQAYIVFGRGHAKFDPVLELSKLNGTNGFIINGLRPKIQFGQSVSGLGDVDGDGLHDIIIGAHGDGIFEGQAYVIYGSKNPFPPVFDVSALDGSNGFVLDGPRIGSDFGYSVSGAGDIDNDGHADIIVGAIDALNANNTPVGAAYVIYGRKDFPASFNVTQLVGKNGFVIYGEALDDRFGCSVASAGRFNGDDYADIIVGATMNQPSGKAYILFGGPRQETPSIDADRIGNMGVIIRGINRGDAIGNVVKSLGDLNHDGFEDVAIGGSGFNGVGLSKSFVVYGFA